MRRNSHGRLWHGHRHGSLTWFTLLSPPTFLFSSFLVFILPVNALPFGFIHFVISPPLLVPHTPRPFVTTRTSGS